MEQSTGGHYLDTGDGPIRLDPPSIVMESTEIPERYTRADGTVVEGLIRVVHAEGVPVPARLDTVAVPGSEDMRRCEWHEAMVPPEQTKVVGTDGDGEPLYACKACVHFYGIRLLVDHPAGSTGAPIADSHRFIGRPDGLPTAPGSDT